MTLAEEVHRLSQLERSKYVVFLRSRNPFVGYPDHRCRLGSVRDSFETGHERSKRMIFENMRSKKYIIKISQRLDIPAG